MTTPHNKRKVDSFSSDTSSCLDQSGVIPEPKKSRSDILSLVCPSQQSTPIKTGVLDPSFSSFAPDESTIMSDSEEKTRVDASEFFRNNFLLALQDSNVQTVLAGILKGILTEQDERIANLEKKVADQETRIAELEIKCEAQISKTMAPTVETKPEPDTSEQRESSVIIRGILEGIHDTNLVNRLINEEIGLPFAPYNITNCTRLGRQRQDGGVQPLRVIFRTKEIRDSVYTARLNLRERLPQVFIHEDLLPEVANLAYKARVKFRNGELHRTWTRNGSVFIVRTEGGVPEEITSETDLTPIDAAQVNQQHAPDDSSTF